MRKLVIALAIALAGCSTTLSGHGTVTPDAQFQALVIHDLPAYGYVGTPSDELISEGRDYAHVSCHNIRQGGSWATQETSIEVLYMNGVITEQRMNFFKTALDVGIKVYCPAYWHHR